MSKIEINRQANAPFFSKIISDKYLLLFCETRVLELYDLEHFSLIWPIELEQAHMAQVLEQKALITVFAEAETLWLLFFFRPSNEALFITESHKKIVRTDLLNSPSRLKIAGKMLGIFGQRDFSLYQITGKGAAFENIKTEGLLNNAVVDFDFEQKTKVLGFLCRKNFEIVIARVEGTTLLKLKVCAQNVPNLFFSGIKGLKYSSLITECLLQDVEGKFYYAFAKEKEEQDFKVVSLPGIYQDALLLASGRVLAKSEQSIRTLVYEENSGRIREELKRQVPRRFALVNASEPFLLIWEISDLSVYFLRFEIKQKSLESKAEEKTRKTEASQFGSFPERKVDELVEFSNNDLEAVLKASAGQNCQNSFQIFSDLVKLANFAHLSFFLEIFSDSISQKLSQIVLTVLKLIEELGYAKFDFYQHFDFQSEDKISLEQICVFCLEEFISDTNQLPPISLRSFLSTSEFLDSQEIDSKVGCSLLKQRNPLLFAFLEKAHLIDFFRQKIETENYKFFETSAVLLKEFPSVFEVLDSLENFHVLVSRETLEKLAEYLPGIAARILAAVAAGAFLRPKFTLDNVSHDFPNFNIIKLYNTVYHLIKALIDLSVFSQGKEKRACEFGDRKLLLVFLEALTSAGRFDDLFDLLYFKQEHLDVPGFEALLLRQVNSAREARQLSLLEPFFLKVQTSGLLSYKMNIIRKCLSSRLFLLTEKVENFDEVFRHKSEAKIAEAYSQIVKEFRRQLLAEQYLQEEKKEELWKHCPSVQQYKAAALSLKARLKGRILHDEKLVDLLVKTSKVLLHANKQLEFLVLVNSMLDRGLAAPLAKLLTSLLASGCLPDDFFQALEEAPKLRGFLDAHAPTIPKTLPLRERFLWFLVRDVHDYGSLSELLALAKKTGRRKVKDYFERKKSFVVIQEPELGFYSPIKFEKKNLEIDLEGQNQSLIRRYKIIVQYCLIDIARGFQLFEKLFSLEKNELLEENVDHFVRVLKILRGFKKLPQAFSEGILEKELIKNFIGFVEKKQQGQNQEPCKIAALKFSLELAANQPVDLSLVENLWNLKSLDSLLKEAKFSALAKKFQFLFEEILFDFIRQNLTLMNEKLENFEKLDFISDDFFLLSFEKITKNHQLANLITIRAFIKGKTTTSEISARLLCSLPTSQLNARKFISLEKNAIKVDSTALEDWLKKEDRGEWISKFFVELALQNLANEEKIRALASILEL